jgi:hypothetical protein
MDENESVAKRKNKKNLLNNCLHTNCPTDLLSKKGIILS